MCEVYVGVFILGDGFIYILILSKLIFNWRCVVYLQHELGLQFVRDRRQSTRAVRNVRLLSVLRHRTYQDRAC